MLFQVRNIEFDFTDDTSDEPLEVTKQKEITDDAIGQIWEADDDDDLVEEITCAYGWCINSIEFVNILS